MTREGALLVMLGVVVVLLGLGVVAWLRRRRRDGGLVTPYGDAPSDAAERFAASGFYVATTRRGEPLERLAIRGLGFRSRVDVTVTDRGVALAMPGQATVFLPVDRLDDVSLATVAIDRVVEPGGLVRVAWRIDTAAGAPQSVDTYLRPQDVSARVLADAIDAILTPEPHPSTSSPSTATPTGNDA
ncbi:PH-like domain-containing protein [Microbacterium dextranolyticum]|uniref:PH domain-containing protein n=1 Tax=Microbacterium dextranolyticum TaxID=36806 RepID=A0A9W6HM65_9MICO|nr:hypothetical protein [Microbacterium dextranolyticum]MBM7463055.1 hypothetical protein [Microbacterium dextranolyticum]GLJ95840.1 hypothetical protein GCM10017591_19030 [Microbacterium dextranolyticum]